MSKATILIIDDEKSFANLLKSFLGIKEEGKKAYQIEIAHNLESAIALIESENSRPDLIITDLRLKKGLEGLAIFDYLKENNLDIPTIIITAFGNKENILKCIPKRPYYLLEKTGSFDYLKKKIDQILTEVKSQNKSKRKPSVATARALLKNLPRKQHFNLLLERIEKLTLSEYEELEEELPLLRLSIKDGEQEKTEINKIDLEREAQGLLPISIIEKGNIYMEKHSYKSKTTGKRSIYPYFYLRWTCDDGSTDFEYLGRYEKIKDPIILEKIHQQFPEFKIPDVKKYQ